MKRVLRIWGWLCLLFSVAYIGQVLYAAANPYAHFKPGATGLGQWIGMGLISLGLAQVIELLEKK